MSQAHVSSWSAAPTAGWRRANRWLARRRIAISLIGFTSLVIMNVAVWRTVPCNPWAVGEPLVATALCMLLLGLAIRSWAAGTLNKSRELTTVGPYALVRNPLYVGSFLMMFGFCTLCRDWPTLAFVAGPVALLYWSQVRFEERNLIKLFPTQWTDYERSTPRIFPRRLAAAAWGGWSWQEWKRNREYNAVVATAVGLLGIWVWYQLRQG